jgi:hypothetical protein
LLLALEASYGRSCLNALSFLKKMCINKPLVLVDRGPWYRWAFERLGLEYRYERFGMRNRVERFFRYLKERTIVFHHKLSARNHIQRINNLKQFLQAHENGRYAVHRREYGEGLCFDAAHTWRAGGHAWQGYPVHRRPDVQKLSDSFKRHMPLDKITLDDGGVAAPELARYVKPLLDRLHVLCWFGSDLGPGGPQVAEVFSAAAAVG